MRIGERYWSASAFLLAGEATRRIAAQNVWRANITSLLSLAAAAGLWGLSLRGVNLSNINDLGLMSALPLTFYAALIIVVLNACLTLNRRQMPDWMWLLHPVLFILILHGTPNLLYGTLRYSWAWKHIGIVDYIQRHGVVDPNITFLKAYHNWPGFFTLNTLFTEVAGLDSALAYAGWAPVFFNLIDLGALWLIVTSLTDDHRLMRLSIWFFYITSWVGQDYFAPQALNYFLHLVILGICLRWFRIATPLSYPTLKRWRVWERAMTAIQKVLQRVMARDGQGEVIAPAYRAGLLVIVVLIFMTIASSHQLTPFMTIAALAAIVAFQRCSPRTLPIITGLLAMAWITFMATAFMQGQLEDIVTSIGQLENNLGSSLRPLGPISPGQQFVALMARGLTLGVWGLAVLGGGRRLRHGQLDLSAVLLAMTPFAILGGSSYGGEVLFRVYLFSLPFMAFLAAGLAYPGPASGASRWSNGLALLLSSLLLTGFLFAYYGKERQYHFSRNEVAAAEFLYTYAPPGSLLIEGARNYPSQFRNYENFTYVPLANESVEERQKIIRQPVEILSRWMSNSDYVASYLLITRSQKTMIEALGDMPIGAVAEIEQTLRQSGKFRVWYANDDATIYVLRQTTPEPLMSVASSVASAPEKADDFGEPLRAMLAFGFLLVGPGLAYVRLLRLRESFAVWTLALALSLTLDVIVSEALVLAHLWTPARGLYILMGLSLVGAFLQIVPGRAQVVTGDDRMILEG